MPEEIYLTSAEYHNFLEDMSIQWEISHDEEISAVAEHEEHQVEYARVF